jgi:Holliday junction resolvasome RuvABC ATP-dependent DNA helicase subunit
MEEKEGYLKALTTIEVLYQTNKISSELYLEKKKLILQKLEQTQAKSPVKVAPVTRRVCGIHGPYESKINDKNRSIEQQCPLCAKMSWLHTPDDKKNAFLLNCNVNHLLESKCLFPSDLIHTLQEKDSKLATDIEDGLQELRNDTYSFMNETMMKAQEKTEHALVFQALVLISHKEEIKEIEVLLQAYMSKKRDEIHPLLFISLARYARFIKKNDEARIVYRLILKSSKLESIHDWVTEEELDFVRSKEMMIPVQEKVSPIVQKWKDLKGQGSSSPAMDELMDMIGMEEPKTIALDLYCVVEANKKISQQKNKQVERTNFIFTGNPGTGKTTVARLYGKLLNEIGLRKKDTFIELVAQNLLAQGSKKFEDHIKDAVDGVLFIDEVYQLDPFRNSEGKAIVECLMGALDKYETSLTVIVAGYKDDITEKFLKFNEGLKRRFTKIIEFADFEEEQLKMIWEGLFKKCDWKMETSIMGVVVARRLAKQRGTKGFGNGGDVKKLFESCKRKALSRQTPGSSVELVMKMEDLLGERPDPKTNVALDTVLKKLESKVGWAKIKENINNLISASLNNYELEMCGEIPKSFMLHSLFLGNPGTGKTTCAELYGELLKSLNFLSDGRVLMKVASDFIGSAVGSTPEICKKIFEEAQGKILVIDEAYNLMGSSNGNDTINYGKEAIGVIVEKVAGSPGQDLCVIMCGYVGPMEKMFNEQNEGLVRRFEQRFYFEDYIDDELFQILNGMIKSKQVTMSLKFKQEIVKHVSKKRSMQGFGNAGAIQSALDRLILNAQKRPFSSPLQILQEDMDLLGSKTKNPFVLLDSLYNIDPIKKEFQSMQNKILVAHRDNRPQDIDELKRKLYFLFTGPPGTGKTTVARALGIILYELGLIPTDKVVETAPGKIVGTYVGKAEDNMNSLLNSARGGVLFIDEAYGLKDPPFGTKALDTLVQAMTSKEHGDGKTVVILAGYTNDIYSLLGVNDGLARRFKKEIQFHSLGVNESWSFFCDLVKKDAFELQDVEKCKEVFEEWMSQVIPLPTWGNYGDLITILSDVKDERSNRVVKESESIPSICFRDFEPTFTKFVKGRIERGKSKTENKILQSLAQQLVQTLENEQPKQIQKENQKEKTKPPPKQNQEDVEERQEVKTRKIVILTSLEKVFSELGYTEEQALAAVCSEQLPQEVLNLMTKGIEMDEKEIESIIKDEKIHIKQRLERIIQDKKDEEDRRRKHEEEMRKIQDEKERQEILQREREELEKKQKVQQAIRQLTRCVAGYQFSREGNGWRCAGGSHYVSDSEIERYMK